MVWQEPQNHLNDCYFCAVKTTGLTSKTRSSVEHPSLPSAIEPVPHSVELSILGLPYRPENSGHVRNLGLNFASERIF